MDVVADISMARKELGWHPEYSFQTGIEHLINSVMRNK
jgi:nucleoside-diphosphate-sugar epimerase